MTIKTIALVKSGVVENIVTIDDAGTWEAPAGYTVVDADSTSKIGGAYNSGTEQFADPAEKSASRQEILEDKLAGADLTLAEVNELLRERL